MTIDSLLKSARLAYKGERANLVCETLLAHFLGKNRVFLHSHSEAKIQDILADSALKIAESSGDSASVIAREQSDRSNPLLQGANLAQDSAFCHSHQGAESIQNCHSLQSKESKNLNLETLQKQLFEAISRLNCGYPLEYITKKVSFYSQEFFIDCGALIPRPETELLVDRALQLIKAHDIQKIYEIGVGSGIISIMLCLLNPRIQIIATDISPTALKIAQKNIALKSAIDSTLKSRILLVESDLLKSVDFNPKDSLIISNPPYIAEDYAIPRNLTYEPQNALFGGKNGDEILRQIIALNSDYLCCEIGHNQGHLADFLTCYKSVEFYKDYAGFTRGFVAVK
ncbi:N5-glutamine methyltransferase family protein [Helicobacter sp. 23-1045]